MPNPLGVSKPEKKTNPKHIHIQTNTLVPWTYRGPPEQCRDGFHISKSRALNWLLGELQMPANEWMYAINFGTFLQGGKKTERAITTRQFASLSAEGQPRGELLQSTPYRLRFSFVMRRRVYTETANASKLMKDIGERKREREFNNRFPFFFLMVFNMKNTIHARCRFGVLELSSKAKNKGSF